LIKGIIKSPTDIYISVPKYRITKNKDNCRKGNCKKGIENENCQKGN
jgi:hypothetical protein